MTTIKPKLNATTHVYRDAPVIPCERKILSRFARPGMPVLDVGCGAIGRSARVLREFSCEVYSIDVNTEAILEFSASEESHGITTLVADATALPFDDGFFELVLVALHGLDYLLPIEKRLTMLKELHRVMCTSSDSYLVFNTLNPVGVLTSPRGLLEPAYWKWRLKQLISLGFLETTLHDSHGIEMYQALPRSVIAQVVEATGLKPISGVIGWELVLP